MRSCKYKIHTLIVFETCRCKKCSYEFSSGKKPDKSAEEGSLSSKKRSSLGKRRESDDADGSMPKTPTREERQEISAFSLEEETKSSPAKRTLFEHGIEAKEKNLLRNELYQEYEEEKKAVVRNDDSQSSETDSDQEGSPSGLRRKGRRDRR